MKLAVIAKELLGIVFAFAMYWSVAVAVGLVLYHLFPPSFPAAADLQDAQTFSFMAGVSFGAHWQNIPGNIIGFIAALYAFRRICSEK